MFDTQAISGVISSHLESPFSHVVEFIGFIPLKISPNLSKFEIAPTPSIAPRVFQNQSHFDENIDHNMPHMIATPPRGPASCIIVPKKSVVPLTATHTHLPIPPATAPTHRPVFAATELSAGLFPFSIGFMAACVASRMSGELFIFSAALRTGQID